MIDFDNFLPQDALGDVLAQALSAVAKERPADPVQFVADFLLRKHGEMKTEAEKVKSVAGMVARWLRQNF